MGPAGQGTNGLRTVAYSHNTSAHFQCGVCGQEHEQNCGAVRIVDPDVGDALQMDVCPVCVLVGPEGAAKRARDWAQRLYRAAEAAEFWAGKIETITGWATLEDLVRAELATEAAMREIPEAEVPEWIEARAAKETAYRERYIRAYRLGDAEAKAEIEREQVWQQVEGSRRRIASLETSQQLTDAKLELAKAEERLYLAMLQGADTEELTGVCLAARARIEELQPEDDGIPF
jgi:hypothetical protein